MDVELVHGSGLHVRLGHHSIVTRNGEPGWGLALKLWVTHINYQGKLHDKVSGAYLFTLRQIQNSKVMSFGI